MLGSFIVGAQTPAPADTSTKPRVLKSIFGTVATDSVPVGPNAIREKAATPLPSDAVIRTSKSVVLPDGDSLRLTPDTVQLSARQNAAIHKIIPKKATIRSLMFPGLGQAYNRQYYKMPFIYAGFAVIGYDIVTFTNNYNAYIAGYRTAYYSPTPTTGQYKTAVVFGKELTVTQLKQASDFWRRYRDFNVILGVLLWGLQAVEANVAAHLKTFDISDDISATWKPTLLPTPGGMAPGIRLTFNFNH